MIKVIAFVRKRPDLTREEFERRWTVDHTPLARLLGQRPYRVNIVRACVDDGQDPPYDGTAEMYWPDETSLREALASPEGIIAGNDVANFAASVQLVIVDEHVVCE
jgi:uncharacterized protein (TIGR02118 family)